MRPTPNFLVLTVSIATLLLGRSAFGQTSSPDAVAAPSKSPSQPSPARTFSSPCSPTIDVNDLLKQYASLTHFQIIRDNFVQGKVCIDDVAGLGPEEAIQIIERTLFADGFAILQIDPGTVEIVGLGLNARGVGIPTIAEPSQIPKHERLISYFFQFKYADAAKVLKLFAQYLSPPKGYTSFLQSPGVNALWVTERTSVIRELLVTAEKIDVPQQEQRAP